MNKPFYIFFTFLIVCLVRFSFSQTNLVPNGSFEDYTMCPTAEDQLPNCIGWMKANLSTVDYVNTCAPISGGVNSPFYFYAGYQNPFQGNAYCGIGFYYQSVGTACEYIQTRLTESLKAFHTYRLNFYVVLANHSVYTTNNFGAYISKQRPYSNTYDAFNLTPQIIIGYIKDTLDWVKVSQTFVAWGDEQYLTIGRFDYNGAPQLLPVVPDTNIFYPDKYGYYMVDSVSMYDVSDGNLPEFPTVFSPNGDGTNDFYSMPVFNFFKEQEMVIYNRWGIEVAKLSADNHAWDGTKNGERISDGVYFFLYSAADNEGKKYVRKGFIQLVR